MKKDTPRYMAMLVLLSLTAILSIMVRHGRATPPRQPLDNFPYKIGDWQGQSLGKFPEEVMRVLQASDYLNRNYKLSEGGMVNLYIGYYEQQRAGESMHSPKNCLPGDGWEVLESRRVPLEIPSLHKTIEVNHYVVEREQQKEFVLYWYDTHGRAFASEYEGKTILVWEGLKTGRTDGSLIRVMFGFKGSEQDAAKVAHAFAAEVYPHLKDYLPE